MKPNDLKIDQSLEEALDNLPDKVADELIKWRTATLEREKVESLLYLKFKGEDGGRTATEIKALVNSSDERYKANLAEAQAEANYERLYEGLMAAKKKADLRTAY